MSHEPLQCSRRDHLERYLCGQYGSDVGEVDIGRLLQADVVVGEAQNSVTDPVSDFRL
jgi:hypothetical protein